MSNLNEKEKKEVDKFCEEIEVYEELNRETVDWMTEPCSVNLVPRADHG